MQGLKQKRPETEHNDGEGKKEIKIEKSNFGFSYSKVLILINIVGYFPLTFILITYTFQISEEYRVCVQALYILVRNLLNDCLRTSYLPFLIKI